MANAHFPGVASRVFRNSQGERHQQGDVSISILHRAGAIARRQDLLCWRNGPNCTDAISVHTALDDHRLFNYNTGQERHTCLLRKGIVYTPAAARMTGICLGAAVFLKTTFCLSRMCRRWEAEAVLFMQANPGRRFRLQLRDCLEESKKLEIRKTSAAVIAPDNLYDCGISL